MTDDISLRSDFYRENRIRELEAEIARLRQELAAERERAAKLEAKLKEEQEESTRWFRKWEELKGEY